MARPELLQYDIRHDRKEKDIKFLAKQLETHLKERFNVLVSTVEYGIKNGHLVKQGTEEPFIESIKKGRDFIQSVSPNNLDFDRENAEVMGFAKIDSFLSDPATLLNSKMLSISLKGDEESKYQHNFYDIFTLKERNGKKYVELSRYSSALSRGEYAQRLGWNKDNPPPAEYFLANPIDGGSKVTVEEIHKTLHVNHEYMEPQEFDRIWNSSLVQFFVSRYESDRSASSFNAILNAADEVWKNKDKRFIRGKYEVLARDTISYHDIKFLEEKKVRQAGGQCPGKSGADSLNNSPFSVFNFANLEPDKYGERTFDCPECGKINVRPENELVKNCQHCGSSKVSC